MPPQIECKTVRKTVIYNKNVYTYIHTVYVTISFIIYTQKLLTGQKHKKVFRTLKLKYKNIN